MVDKTVSSYMPDYYTGVLEMEKLLEAEDVVLGDFDKKITRTLQNEFVIPADLQGVELFEDQLGIVPEAGQSLDERKQIILMHMLSSKPITVRFMKDFLPNMLLPVTFDVNYAERIALITGKIEDMTKERLRQLEYLLNVYLPANMGRNVEVNYPDEDINQTFKVKSGFVTVVSTSIRNEG